MSPRTSAFLTLVYLCLRCQEGETTARHGETTTAVSIRSNVMNQSALPAGTRPLYAPHCECTVVRGSGLVPPDIKQCHYHSNGVVSPDNQYHGGWKVSATFCYHLDVGLARTMAAIITAGRNNPPTLHPSLSEMGAGVGCYSMFLAHCGVNVIAAMDGAPAVETVTKGIVSYADLTTPVEAKAGWVLSLEVAEHIPKAGEQQFVANLVSNARCGIILSWAGIGQNGAGHVNTQSSRYVISLMASHGFDHDLEASKLLSKVAKLRWFKRLNGTNIFRRRSGAEEKTVAGGDVGQGQRTHVCPPPITHQLATAIGRWAVPSSAMPSAPNSSEWSSCYRPRT